MPEDSAEEAEKKRKEAVEKEKAEGEGGYFAKLITQVIDNVQVFIDRVHIRYEGMFSRHDR